MAVGIHDNYPPGWPCGHACYPPVYFQPLTAAPNPATTGEHRVVSISPSIQEQLGVDPVSKLAAAIERLAAALERGGNEDL